MESFDELQDLHDFLFNETETSSLFVKLTKPMLVAVNYPNLKFVDLQGQAIKLFTENVFDDLSLLETISLNDNLIVKLPDNLFAKNLNLKVISLRYNLIEELNPKVFSSLPALRILDIGQNSIIQVPKACLESKTLSSLNLNSNCISDLNCEAFSQLPALIDLDLSYNCLEIVKISAPKLATLNLHINNISSLTFDLPKLTNLQIDKNCIASFEEIAKNCPDSLCILNLEANMINQISKSEFRKFKRLVSLKITVDLHFNFDSLSYLCQLRKLHITYLGPFNFQAGHVLFAFYKKSFLKDLKLNFANFQSIWFQWMPKINSLKFCAFCCSTPNFEMATEINIFEDILVKMPKLVSLTLENLNDFRLREITNACPVSNALEILSLEGLRNSKLTNLFRNFYLLVHLNIVQSWTKTISKTDFENLYFLESLNLSYSKLERIESECFYTNSRLKTINLSYCSIKFIADFCFVNLTQLKHLNLTNNPIRIVSIRAFSGIDLNRHILEHDYELVIILDVQATRQSVIHSSYKKNIK